MTLCYNPIDSDACLLTMSAERTEEKGSQRPRALLIEKVSADGSRVELETTAFSRNNGVKDFLGKEAKNVARNMQKLERKIIASRRKPSGKLRRLSEVSPIKEVIQEDINKMKLDLDVLQGIGGQPIKIKMIGEQVVGWEHPSRGEDMWLHYVGDEHPEILEFFTEERALLQRIFMNKYALMQGRKGTVNEYEELLYELRDKDPKEKLAPYRREISQRLSRH